MKCGIIGHRKVEQKDWTEFKSLHAIKKLLDKVDAFNFGSNSEFNDICWKIVAEFQETDTHIKMVNFRCENEKPILSKNKVAGKMYYDEIISPANAINAGKRLCIERNKALIDNSDIILFYYDEKYSPQHSNSGTKIAYEYALKQGKIIINIFK